MIALNTLFGRATVSPIGAMSVGLLMLALLPMVNVLYILADSLLPQALVGCSSSGSCRRHPYSQHDSRSRMTSNRASLISAARRSWPSPSSSWPAAAARAAPPAATVTPVDGRRRLDAGSSPARRGRPSDVDRRTGRHDRAGRRRDQATLAAERAGADDATVTFRTAAETHPRVPVPDEHHRPGVRAAGRTAPS